MVYTRLFARNVNFMIEPKLKDDPRIFQLHGSEMRDHGKIIFYSDSKKTNEILILENATGKQCDITATSWGYYLGGSLNDRMKKNGFRTALMVNKNDQIYLIAVDSAKMNDLDSYLRAQENSRILYWIDEFLGAKDGG